MDGRNFFANEVFRSAFTPPAIQGEEPAPAPAQTAARRR